jgi:hypothetical protein
MQENGVKRKASKQKKKGVKKQMGMGMMKPVK